MAISDDFTITPATKKIAHTSGTTVYTVNAFYSWLMDTFDELSYMSYDVPMSAQTPTAYSMINGWTFNADSDTQYLKTGAITVAPGGSETVFSNIYTVGSDSDIASQTIYVEQNNAVITGWWSAGHIDILVKTKNAGTLIASGNLTVYAREYGYLYDFYTVDCSAGGRNVVPVAIASDINNQTSSVTVAAYAGITFTFGTVSKNLNNGNGAKNYDVIIDCGTHTLKEVYEFTKYRTRRGETTTLNSRQGQIFQASGAYTPIKATPFGTFDGSKFFGARGVWIENYAANQSFQLIAADNSVQSPPNTVYVNITGLVSGDRVSVFKLTGVGGSIEKNTYTYSSKTASTIVVTGAIASSTPQAGYLRVVHSGTEILFAYTSWASSTFSGVTPDPTGTAIAGTDAVFVPYIDAQASGTSINNSLIYASDIPVRARVRKKGILPFEIDGTIGSTGYSQAAIRTTDSIVT